MQIYIVSTKYCNRLDMLIYTATHNFLTQQSERSASP